MNIGIDKISFYVPRTYLDIKTLAKARGVDEEKYTKGLLVNKMSVAPLNEDIISMAANATLNFLTSEDIEHIDLIFFTTESGVDYSKAAATHLISILGLKNNVRAVELKQACYSTAAALYFAKGHILQNPTSKVLILSADIAKYGVNSGGEPTQGAGATAMIISQEPAILKLEDHYGIYADDVYDFWRPDGEVYAHVDGHFSNSVYQKFFLNTYNVFLEKSNLSLNDINAFTFHIPYAKIGLKTLNLIANEEKQPHLFKNFYDSVVYNQNVGNIYTGSLFLSLTSLLENGSLNAGERIGIYAYGSGAVAEFFSATLVEGYKNHLNKKLHEQILNTRESLAIEAYEKLLSAKFVNNEELPLNDLVRVQLKGLINYQRMYTRLY